jgi:benzoyl-CoA reductase/2-hydroxyglutaryl-CoA dehydratase subunit BcrC/BadD/HgdB
MAAGYQPIRIFGGESLPRQRDPRIYHLMCPYVRAVFHRFANDEQNTPHAMVFVRCCDAMLRLHDLWKAYVGGPVYLLDLPKIDSQEATEYLSEVLKAWSEEISINAPHRVTERDLREAIRSMNEARGVFSGFFQALAEGRSPLPYSWIHQKVRQWLSDPTDSLLSHVKALWDDAISAGQRPSEGARVLLVATMLDQKAIIKTLEDSGLQVVAEDECLGWRHFIDPVNEEVNEEGDPYFALAERYLSRWPCSRMKGMKRRLERLEELLDLSRADALVVIQLKFCDQSGFDLPLVLSRMRERQVPVLVVENDYSESALGQIRTRFEAFSEMLQQPWE